MRAQRRGFYFEWRPPRSEDYGWAGLAVRFLINVAALWVAQWVLDGFDIESFWALVFGAVIFGVINALIRPYVAMVTCLLSVVTLGLFTWVINAAMLGLTAWIASLFDMAFYVEGVIDAFLAALIISIVSVPLSWWASRNVLPPFRRGPF